MLIKSCQVLTGEATALKGRGTFCIPMATLLSFYWWGEEGHANGNQTLLTLIHLLAPSQCMEHLQSCLPSSGCVFSLSVQLTKSWAVLSRRSLLETALMLWVVTEQHKMNSAKWALGHGCSGLCITRWKWRVPKLRGCSAFKCWATTDKPSRTGLISSCCWNRSAYYSSGSGSTGKPGKDPRAWEAGCWMSLQPNSYFKLLPFYSIISRWGDVFLCIESPVFLPW